MSAANALKERARDRVRQARVLAASRVIEPKLAWILGSPRSGSTWLLGLLGDHPRVVPINEPLIGLYFSPFLLDLPGWNTGSLDGDNFTFRKFQADNPNQFLAREFEPAWLPPLASLMRRRFAAHAVKYPTGGPLKERVIAIKEPNGSESADLIMRALPRSRLLFLARDPRDVVDSDLAANLRGSWVSKEFPGGFGIDERSRADFVWRSATKWLLRTEMVQYAYAHHAGPKLFVRYEELLANPATELRRILEWLDLHLDEAALSKLIERHAFESVAAKDRGADKFHRAATPGLWRDNLTGAEQATLDQIVGPKLAELGYDRAD